MLKAAAETAITFVFCVSSVSVLWLAVAAYHKGGLWMYNMYAHGITGIMMV